MFYWIYDYPTPILAGMFAAASVGFTWFGSVFVRPFLRSFIRGQAGANDLLGYIISCHGVYYGILLGLLAVAAYQNLGDVEKEVNQEAATLTAFYRDISAYPEPHRSELQDLTRAYTRYVIDEAWPAQRKGLIPEAGGAKLGALHETLCAFEPQTKGQEALHAEGLHQFNRLSELRRLRLFNVQTGIPAVLWYVVIVGAIVNIVLVWLFEMRLLAQFLLGGILAFFLGTVICLVAAMDNPFRGEVSIPPDAFESVYQSLMAPTTSIPIRP